MSLDRCILSKLKMIFVVDAITVMNITKQNKIKRIYNSFNKTEDIVVQNNKIINHLKILSGEKMLELGCGLGLFSRKLAKRVGSSGTVIGIDNSEMNISLANESNKIPWLSFIQGDAMNLDIKSSTIDALISIQLAEYLPDVDSFLSGAFRVLNDNGRAVIVTTDWKSLKWSQWSSDFSSKWLKHCYNPVLHSQLREKLISAGFRFVDIDKFNISNHVYSPVYYSYWLSLVIQEYMSMKKFISVREGSEWVDTLVNGHKLGQYYFGVDRYIFYASK